MLGISKVEDNDTTGTSLSGYLEVSYQQLLELLGRHHDKGDAYKVDARWKLKINGKVITIYNYKDGRNYNRSNGLPVRDITDWHIGSSEDVDAEIFMLAHVLKCKYKRSIDKEFQDYRNA